MSTPTNLETLASVIRKRGPIPSVRVSTAKQGSVPYPYWGAVRYSIRLAADGTPTNVAQEHATRDRRTIAGAERDAEAIADREDRVELQRIGRLTEADAAFVLLAVDVADAVRAAAKKLRRDA